MKIDPLEKFTRNSADWQCGDENVFEMWVKS